MPCKETKEYHTKKRLNVHRLICLLEEALILIDNDEKEWKPIVEQLKTYLEKKSNWS